MKTSDFNFHLPEHLLAEHPSEHRDEARLMVLTERHKPLNINYLKTLSIILTKTIYLSLTIPKFSQQDCTEIKKKTDC